MGSWTKIPLFRQVKSLSFGNASFYLYDVMYGD